jgi:hypothetical protein
MKKTIAITSALAAVTGLATAEIKINDFLSLEGFVDMSYSHTDIDDAGSDNSFAVDQTEIDLLFNFGKVTGRADIEYLGGANEDANLEQAFATYDLGNGRSITAGRYESALGLEAKEPTGLYQYSTAYDMGAADINDGGLGGVDILPQYGQGVKLTQVSGDNVYSLSVQDESFENDGGRLGGDDQSNDGGEDSSYSIEAAASIALGDGMTWFLGGAYEDSDTDDNNTYVLNTHLLVESGALTWGAEVSYGDAEGGFSNGLGRDSVGATDEEVLQALLMANYAYSDCCSITGRISYSDHEGEVGAADVDADFLKYTLAHNYAVTDNLAVITEISLVDGEVADADYEALVGAVEVLFTF